MFTKYNNSFTFLVDCWQQDAHKRPSFQGILEDLEEISDSSFAQDDQGSFRTLQDGWQTEIEQIFDELRKKEKVLNHDFINLIKSSYKKLSSGC